MATARRTAFIGEPLLLIAGAILALYFARDILIPLALALTLNFLLAPAVTYLQKIGLRRIPAVAVAIVLAMAVFGGIGWVVAKQLVRVADDLPSYSSNIHSKMAALHAPLGGGLGKAIQGVTAVADELSESQAAANTPAATADREKRAARGPQPPTRVEVVPAPVGDIQYLESIVRPLARPLGMILIVSVFTVFMLVKREDLRNRVLLLAGVGRLSVMTEALNDAATRISRYLVMQFLVNAGYGIVIAVGLYGIGVPNATLWGVIAGTLRLIPYVGTLAGAAFPICLSIAFFPSWLPTLYVMLLFGMLELIVSNVIEPWLYGSHTGISSLALLITAIFWTLLWGWAGLVLSTPLTVCVIVLGRYVPQMSFLNTLLGDEAELSPEAQFYQRLLAMDQREAKLIADRFLRGKQLFELYDGVLIPALTLAEEDRHKGTLEDAREAFLYLSATELVAEFSDYVCLEPKSNSPINPLSVAGQKAPSIVCLPAEDRADELTAAMLAQLLEQSGFKTLLLQYQFLSDEVLNRLAEEPSTIICISAVPPFAFAHARTLCLRVRERLPLNRIIVGLWGSQEDLARVKGRFGPIGPNRIFTKLESTVNQIFSWQQQDLAGVEITAVHIEVARSPAVAGILAGSDLVAVNELEISDEVAEMRKPL